VSVSSATAAPLLAPKKIARCLSRRGRSTGTHRAFQLVQEDSSVTADARTRASRTSRADLPSGCGNGGCRNFSPLSAPRRRGRRRVPSYMVTLSVPRARATFGHLRETGSSSFRNRRRGNCSTGSLFPSRAFPETGSVPLKRNRHPTPHSLLVSVLGSGVLDLGPRRGENRATLLLRISRSRSAASRGESWAPLREGSAPAGACRSLPASRTSPPPLLIDLPRRSAAVRRFVDEVLATSPRPARAESGRHRGAAEPHVAIAPPQHPQPRAELLRMLQHEGPTSDAPDRVGGSPVGGGWPLPSFPRRQRRGVNSRRYRATSRADRFARGAGLRP